MVNKPNFLVIGTVRSGTTLLHEYFLQHPDIYVPKSKRPEPHFFLKTNNYLKGENWYHSTFFSGVKNEKAIGEISTSYIYGEHVPARIHDYNSELKFIIILRDPIDRAFSNYWHSKVNGFENLDFYEAILIEDERLSQLSDELKEIAPFAYVGRSHYLKQFKNYLKYFRKEQFLILLFEDLIKNPLKELKEISSFLKVDENFKYKMINNKPNKSKPEHEEPEFRSKEYLKEIFEAENKELANLFELNLGEWKS